MSMAIFMSCFLTGLAVGGLREPGPPGSRREDGNKSLEARPEAGFSGERRGTAGTPHAWATGVTVG